MDKYLTCPKMYDIHYNERLRPGGTSSALIFGTAMDEGLNELLLNGSLEKAIEIFREAFDWVDLRDVTWDDRDRDPSIVANKGFESPDHYAWACMRVKGRMLLEAYYKNIYPLIEEVESVQKELRGRPGFIDAVVHLRGYGRVLLDNKTAARPYQDNSITDSTQLHLYAHDQGIDKIAFAVLIKQIQKNTKRICTVCGFDGSFVRHKSCPQITNGDRCRGSWDESYAPEAKTQLLIADVQPTTKELVTSTITEVERAIEGGIYPRNLRACGKIYGKPCPYINYCWKKDKQGLEHKPEENKNASKK